MQTGKYGSRQLRLFLGEVVSALREKDMAFPELFDDYEQYHHVINTGRSARAELISEWIEPNATLLDVGVGDGVVAEYLVRKKNLSINGIDISQIACQKALDKGIPSRVKDINTGLHLAEDEYYDYIMMMEVIEHTTHPQKLLLDAVSHARKGVIVTIPNSAYVKWRLHMLRGYTPRQSFTHLHFWSIRDFELFCRELKVQIKDFKTFLPGYLLPFRNLLAWQQCWLISPQPYQQ